jgi:MFS family permease
MTGGRPGLAGERSTPSRRRAVVWLASSANILVLADATIVLVALPSLADALGFTAAQLPWVVNAYSLAFGALLLPSGWAADRYGPGRLFVGGLGLFGLGCVICAVAGSVALMLVGRAVQGVGGALGCPAALALVTGTRDPRERTAGLALWSAAGAAAVAVAPVVGGTLTSALGWRAVFWMPAVACLVVTVAAVRLTSTVKTVAAGPPAGGAWGADTSATGASTPGPSVHTGQTPPGRRGPRLPARSVAACAILAVGSGAVVGTSYVSTLWLQEDAGLSPSAAGLALLPLSLGIVAGALVAPRLLRRWPSASVTVLGLATAAVGAIGLAALVSVGTVGGAMAALAVLGLGFGGQSVPVSLVATSVPGEAGLASASYQMSGQFGGALGLAALTAVALADGALVAIAAAALAAATLITRAWRTASAEPALVESHEVVDADSALQPTGVGGEPDLDLDDDGLTGTERGGGPRLSLHVG